MIFKTFNNDGHKKSFSHHRGLRDHREIFFITSNYLCDLCVFCGCPCLNISIPMKQK